MLLSGLVVMLRSLRSTSWSVSALEARGVSVKLLIEFVNMLKMCLLSVVFVIKVLVKLLVEI